MKVRFLGTGTSQGVPVIGCNCSICKSTDQKDKRLRSSISVETEQTTIVIDSGPDFRQQLLRENFQKLDALLFTHSHKDHTAGMDDVRAFNFKQKKPMDVYARPMVQAALKKEFSYIFDTITYPGIPKINFQEIPKSSFTIGDISILPIEVMHYKLPVLGFRFGDFTYITDANYISEEEQLKLKGTKILVLNALRKEKHISHFNLEEAISLAQKIGAEQTYFTHISHLLGTHDDISQELPDKIALSYDGLHLEF